MANYPSTWLRSEAPSYNSLGPAMTASCSEPAVEYEFMKVHVALDGTLLRIDLTAVDVQMLRFVFSLCRGR